MINGFTDAQVVAGLFGVIGGLLVVILVMVGFFATWIVRRLDKIDARLEALTIAVSRLEGAVYHGLPEPRRAVE